MHLKNILSNNKWQLATLFGTWAVFFSRIISGKYVYFLDDLKIIYYPLEFVYARAQNAFELPTWSSHFGFGQPVLSWGQLGFFTPVHVVLRALQINPIDLLQLSVMIYFAIGLFGFYAFLKRLGLSSWPAVTGAIVFTFSGFNIGHLNHVNFYTGTMLLPWLLLAINFFLKNPSLRKTTTLSIIASMMALSAQPQVVTYSFIIAIIVSVVVSYQDLLRSLKESWWKLPSLVLLAAGIFFLLSSFAIFPLKEFLPITERNEDLAVSELFEFSYPAIHLITLVAPYHFGGHDNYTGAKGFQELAAFVGIVPLLLAFAALYKFKNRRLLSLAALTLIVITIIFASGKYSPVYRFLVESHIWPGFNIPGRFVFFLDVGIAILAAVGLQKIVTEFNPKKISLGLVVSLLVAGNLVYLAWDYNPMVSRAEAKTGLPLVRELNGNHDRNRIYSRETLLTTPFDVPPLELENDPESLLLARHLNVVAETSSARWIGALYIKQYREFIEHFFANDRNAARDGDNIHVLEKNRHIFDMAGITHFAQIVPEGIVDEMPNNNFDIIHSQSFPGAKLRLYENLQFYPKARLVQDIVFLTGKEQTFHAMSFDDFEPDKLAFIDGEQPPADVKVHGDIPEEDLPINLLDPRGDATITNYTDTQVDIMVDTPEDSWLIVSDSTTPQWQTFVDGELAPHYRAYMHMKTAFVPAGQHSVSFVYKSPAVELSKKLTLLGLLVIAILLFLPRSKNDAL